MHKLHKVGLWFLSDVKFLEIILCLTNNFISDWITRFIKETTFYQNNTVCLGYGNLDTGTDFMRHNKILPSLKKIEFVSNRLSYAII